MTDQFSPEEQVLDKGYIVELCARGELTIGRGCSSGLSIESRRCLSDNRLNSISNGAAGVSRGPNWVKGAGENSNMNNFLAGVEQLNTLARLPHVELSS